MKKLLSGEYAGRPVFATELHDEGAAESLDVRDSVVFVWTEFELETSNLFETLIQGGAICIWVGGSRWANANFDLLLQSLSKSVTEGHLMSGIAGSTVVTDAVDDFLAAAIPDPETFEVWRSYDLIFFGSSVLAESVVSHISSTYPLVRWDSRMTRSDES